MRRHLPHCPPAAASLIMEKNGGDPMDYQDQGILMRNRLPITALDEPYADRREAEAGRSSRALSLNGSWEFA